MGHDKGDFQSLAERAVALHRSGQLDDAAAAYHEILARFPAHAAVLHNLGVIAAIQGDHPSAISYFDQALEIDAGYTPAHFHRAISLEARGALDAAARGLEETCRLDPGHYDAHRRLGFLWLALGDSGRSLDHFARTYELRRGEDRSDIALPSLTHATRDKLEHDAAQFRLLAREHPDRPRFAELARAYGALARDFPIQPSELTGEQLNALGGDYNTAIHVADAAELKGDVLNPRSETAAETLGFSGNSPGAIILDDFLTPQAFESLRRYLLRSTIWHDFTHIGGHVASYLEDGLACPLLLQIAAAIRSRFPEILADHPLSQAWAFKRLRAGSAIGAHADDATVSINLWLTPDAARAGPGGGMTVCLTPPPPEWDVEDYEKNESRSADFMEEHAGNSLRVDYRANRAVMFHSRLLHRSDDPRFEAGYENHRINLSLLYGKGKGQRT